MRTATQHHLRSLQTLRKPLPCMPSNQHGYCRSRHVMSPWYSCSWTVDCDFSGDMTARCMAVQTVHNVAVAGQRPLTLVLHSMGRFTALRDLSVALFRSYGADNFFASLPPSLTRLRATGLAGFKVLC